MDFEKNKNMIKLIDTENQAMQFITDGNGDYYFTLHSMREARSGDYYSFSIDENSPVNNLFKSFIEQEVAYSNDEKVKMMYKTPYFIIKENEVRIADQNQPVIEAEFVKVCMSQNKIQFIFSNKFPTSIRINGLGRLDHYPFFIPVIELFDALQNNLTTDKNSKKTKKKV